VRHSGRQFVDVINRRVPPPGRHDTRVEARPTAPAEADPRTVRPGSVSARPARPGTRTGRVPSSTTSSTGLRDAADLSWSRGPQHAPSGRSGRQSPAAQPPVASS